MYQINDGRHFQYRKTIHSSEWMVKISALHFLAVKGRKKILFLTSRYTSSCFEIDFVGCVFLFYG